MSLTQISKNQAVQKLLPVGIILLIFSQIYSIAIKDRMHQRIPESSDHYAQAISIVISHHNFGLNGYVGYQSVYERLIASGFNWDNNTNAEVLNEAIGKAAAETNTNSEYLYFFNGDPGYVDYVRLAFNWFGFNVESFLYLYMVIFLLQIAMLYFTFRKDFMVIVGLILFLLGHYITVSGLVGAGHDLWTVHNNRFLPVLGILPIMHICLLALFQKRLNFGTLSGFFVQTAIYIFVLRCRSSVFWMIGPVLIVGGFWLLNRIKISLFDIKGVKVWPVVLALLTVFVSFLVKPYFLDAGYYSERTTASHIFWHPIYVGLAINPEIREIYGPRIGRGERFNININKRFAEVCDENHSDDSPTKAKVRVFVCNNRKAAKIPLIALRDWRQWMLDYRPNDRDAFPAVLKWLHENGKTEEHLYTFSPDERVGHPKWFGQYEPVGEILNDSPASASLREFDSKKDFKWREMDRILKVVVKDAVVNHPFKVFKTIFFIKPFFFLLFYIFYFVRFKSLVGLIVIVLSYVYLLDIVKKASQDEMKKLLGITFAMFLISMVVILTAYPAPYAMSDQSVLLTTSILSVILFLLKGRFFRLPQINEKNALETK